MLSLLLTLFISLFSICPSYYQVEDQYENKVLVLNDKPVNYIANYEDLYYISSFSDYSTTAFLQALLDYERSDGYTHFLDGDSVIQTIYFYDEIYRINLRDIDFSNIGQSELSEYELTYVSYWGDNANNAYIDRYVKFNFVNQDDDTDIWYFTITYRTFYLSNRTDPDSEHLEGDLTNTLIRFNYSDTLAPYFDLGLFAYRYGMSTRQLTLFFKFDSLSSVYNDGYNTGYSNGYSTGYQFGYTEGYTEGSSIDDTASTIFTGILDVALIPVNVFLTIFNFEVFGINIGGIVSGLLTLSVVIVILRFLFGGRKDD